MAHPGYHHTQITLSIDGELVLCGDDAGVDNTKDHEPALVVDVVLKERFFCGVHELGHGESVAQTKLQRTYAVLPFDFDSAQFTDRRTLGAGTMFDRAIWCRCCAANGAGL
jgi:hypothetical protein